MRQLLKPELIGESLLWPGMEGPGRDCGYSHLAGERARGSCHPHRGYVHSHGSSTQLTTASQQGLQH